MKDLLDALRAANPGLPLCRVTDERFRAFGRVLSVPGKEELAAALAETPVPASGNTYTASVPALEETEAVRFISRTVFGEIPVQAGFCNGRGFTLNALEYHRSSEVNFSATGLVLLLALPGDLRDGRMDSSAVTGFYLPPLTAVEIYPRVLHFAPCRVAESGFNCLVVLPRGTNFPLSRVDTAAPGEEKLLWMTNKWMTCHPDSPQAEKGAFPGISGRNITLSLPT